MTGREVRCRRGVRVVAVTAVVIAAVAFLIGANTAGRITGTIVPERSPEELAALLRPYYRTVVPDGAGPFPTAILLSGCDGPHDNLDRWAARLKADGWASVVVDSHTPRGYDEYAIWRLVCAGQLLMGSERAADLLVALDDVRGMTFVDPNRIVLVGSSHGGWTIMDLFAFDPPRHLPYGLSELPGDPTADPLRGVVGAILLYPWCGLGNLARDDGWRRKVPVLFLLAGRDTIAPADYCDVIIGALERRGVPVAVRVFPKSDHAFDQVDHGPATWLRFDPDVTAAALDAGVAFLNRVGGSPAPPPDPRSSAGSPDR